MQARVSYLDSASTDSQTYIGLACIPAHLGDEQVDAERRVRVFEMALEFVDVVLEHLRALRDTSNDTNPSCIQDVSTLTRLLY